MYVLGSCGYLWGRGQCGKCRKGGVWARMSGVCAGVLANFQFQKVGVLWVVESGEGDWLKGG